MNNFVRLAKDKRSKNLNLVLEFDDCCLKDRDIAEGLRKLKGETTSNTLQDILDLIANEFEVKKE